MKKLYIMLSAANIEIEPDVLLSPHGLLPSDVLLTLHFVFNEQGHSKGTIALCDCAGKINDEQITSSYPNISVHKSLVRRMKC